MKGAQLWGFAALCVLSGSGRLLQQAWPSEKQWPFGSCLHFGLIGMLGLAAAVARAEWRRLLLPSAAAVSVAGMCLFVLPSTVLQVAAGKVPEYTVVVIFCAVPLITILAANAFGEDEVSRLLGLMAPSMIGLTGALLLFPIQSPGSVRRWLFLGLVVSCCVVVALASVRMHRLIQHVGVAAAVAIIGLGSATILGLYGASLGWPTMSLKSVVGEALRCAVFDLPVILLTVWLMREVAPTRLSARFLLGPLVTVVEGYALERGQMDARAILAVVLIAAGGAMLLFKDEPDEITGLWLR